MDGDFFLSFDSIQVEKTQLIKAGNLFVHVISWFCPSLESLGWNDQTLRCDGLGWDMNYCWDFSLSFFFLLCLNILGFLLFLRSVSGMTRLWGVVGRSNYLDLSLPLSFLSLTLSLYLWFENCWLEWPVCEVWWAARYDDGDCPQWVFSQIGGISPQIREYSWYS